MAQLSGRSHLSEHIVQASSPPPPDLPSLSCTIRPQAVYRSYSFWAWSFPKPAHIPVNCLFTKFCLTLLL